MKPTLLILAAGMGSRYGGLKQLDPMGPGGETILDYSVFDAIRAGFDRVVFVIRRDFEREFRERIVARFERHVDVALAFQAIDALPAGFAVPPGREKPWGTTHAILCGREAVAAPFAAINADDFYGHEAFAVLARRLAASPVDSTAYCMVGFTLANTLSEHGSVARGVCRTDARGFLADIRELKQITRTADGVENVADGVVEKLTGQEPVSMNMWGFTPRIFPQLETSFREFLAAHAAEPKSECYIPLTVGDLVKSGQATCEVLPTASRWFGVTYVEDRPIVQASIANLVATNAYPATLWG